MLNAIANMGVRRPKAVLVLAGLVFVLAAVFGSSVAAHLEAGGYYDTHAESWQAQDTLAREFHSGDPNLIFEVTAPQGLDSAAALAAGQRIATALQHDPYTLQVSSYFSAPPGQAPSLRSADGHSALIAALISGDDDTAPDRAKTIYQPLVGTHDGITIKAGGGLPTLITVNHLVDSDLLHSEMIAVPLTTIALIWVFGSLIAALLPLAVGLFAIIGTMALLRVLGSLTDVSIYALNMTTAMGLALAIDYSLFIVSRYREELHRGAPGPDAVRTAMHTAGRTVLFSALTVALSLAALTVFPVYFLRSFAYAGVLVVALATLAALVLLPALLTLLGGRINTLDLRVVVRRFLHRPAPAVKPVEQSFWYRLSSRVMRRAVPVGLLLTGILVVLGLPFIHANFGYPDHRVVPPNEQVYQVGNALSSVFPSNAAAAISIVAPDIGGDTTSLGTYSSGLSQIPHVTSVSSAAGSYVHGTPVGPANPAMTKGSITYLNVQTNAEVQSDTAKTILKDLKNVTSPWPVQFTGQTAINSDSLHSLGRKMPLAIALIAIATFLVLFLFTGSIVLPLKALVLNTLSLSATFGTMVWVFQEGHLSWLFGSNLTTTGYLMATMPPLMFCVAFGLSMDYEVFLLSRIREEWLRSGRTTADNTHAVALGLGRTGRIVTAAALLMAIVFATMANARVSFMMMFGAGLALAVVMDATLVRGMLVPAFMRLAGRWNWWAPRPLVRLHERIGLTESEPESEPVRETVSA
ncbi:MAG TPA: MMPL family transporter [Jatrophihabitans sp.]|jgi:RND superfamily putative drug exporter